jgi:hypothetical protein
MGPANGPAHLRRGDTVAVLADIHGNLAALRAVLEDLAQRTQDVVVVAGDLALNGPRPAETLAAVQAMEDDLGAVVISGNTDRYVVIQPKRSPGGQWARSRIGRAGLAYLDALGHACRITPTCGASPDDDLLVVHASPSDDETAVTPEADRFGVFSVSGYVSRPPPQTLRWDSLLACTTPSRQSSSREFATVGGCWWRSDPVSTCPSRQQPTAKRDGHDAAGRQCSACRPCGRDFTERSASAFAGYRWPPALVLLAVRWSVRCPPTTYLRRCGGLIPLALLAPADRRTVLLPSPLEMTRGTVMLVTHQQAVRVDGGDGAVARHNVRVQRG